MFFSASLYKTKLVFYSYLCLIDGWITWWYPVLAGLARLLWFNVFLLFPRRDYNFTLLFLEKWKLSGDPLRKWQSVVVFLGTFFLCVCDARRAQLVSVLVAVTVGIWLSGRWRRTWHSLLRNFVCRGNVRAALLAQRLCPVWPGCREASPCRIGSCRRVRSWSIYLRCRLVSLR